MNMNVNLTLAEYAKFMKWVDVFQATDNKIVQDKKDEIAALPASNFEKQNQWDMWCKNHKFAGDMNDIQYLEEYVKHLKGGE